ncbi:signal peptidase I [Sulfurospirillum sp. T05]|uniref:Signal peptidase I n=1 Tax=Sulfurospirillum tamanense TaxID=2813362 RepID=A0ABS2WSY1_9BACT|nr:signal peptidase I [Sulfurospirillum tamanensis]MBN2964773.1 signal peptidase I [Sulfurospirillum tamanensis]
MKNLLKKLYSFSNSWTGTVVIVLLIIFFIAQAFVIPSGSMKRSLLIGDHLFVKKFSYGTPVPHLPWIEVPVLPDFFGNGHLIEGPRPARGDIVVFRYPLDPKIHYVKRCVATGGDEIIYQDKVLYLRPHEGDDFIKSTYPSEKIVTLGGKLWVKNPFMGEYSGISYDENVDLFTQMTLHLMGNNLAMRPALVQELPLRNDGLNHNAYYFKVPQDEFFMVGDNRDHSNDSRFWGSVPYKHIVGKPWFIYFSWDDNYVIRWDRIGRFVSTVEKEVHFTRGSY